MLVEEFKDNEGYINKIYYPLFLLRRFAYTLCQILLIGSPWTQAMLNACFTYLILAYLLYYKPFIDRQAHISNVISEISVVFVFSSAIFFMVFDDSKSVEVIENICIFSVLGCIFFLMIIGIYNFFLSLKKLYLKFMQSRVKTSPVIKMQQIEVEKN